VIAVRTDGSEQELSDMIRVSDVAWSTVSAVHIRDVPSFSVGFDFPGVQAKEVVVKESLFVRHIPMFIR
jgi:hypothetical protein